MNDSEHGLETMARMAAHLVPELTERLRRHGLGEIEVARGDLRLRVAGSGSEADQAPAAPGPSAPAAAAPSRADEAADDRAESGPPPAVGVPSPAVGFFVYADGLGPGQAVTGGDALGYVEMLGVRHDVRAPRGGTVTHLVAESGEAVEYGQVVVELAPAEASR